MKDKQTLLTEISQLTTNIKANYPELYRSLDENPMTLTTSKEPNADKLAMQEYLESLKQLLKHHIDTQKKTL
ncbi:hypothetical protein SCB49_03549 [unidentified eubacterium SCB49]|nr:hypothetical protein SCB49_03549 [unidentified eubacterium SCB49]